MTAKTAKDAIQSYKAYIARQVERPITQDLIDAADDYRAYLGLSPNKALEIESSVGFSRVMPHVVNVNIFNNCNVYIGNIGK